MFYRFAATSALVMTLLFSSQSHFSPTYAQDGLGFGNKTLYTTDIQYRFTRAPDNKALSVLFDNFGVALVPSADADPTVSRVLPLMIPVTNAEQGAKLVIQARGNAECKKGAKCLAILWVNG